GTAPAHRHGEKPRQPGYPPAGWGSVWRQNPTEIARGGGDRHRSRTTGDRDVVSYVNPVCPPIGRCRANNRCNSNRLQQTLHLDKDHTPTWTITAAVPAGLPALPEVCAPHQRR